MRILKKNLLKYLLWLFPVMFLVNDVLGLNGYQFTVAGKSIRIILFVLTVGVLCLYSCFVLWKEHIPLVRRKNGSVSLLGLLRPLDWWVAAFLVGNGLWATAVPLLVRGNMTFGLKDFSTVLVLALYFPIVFLIRTGYLNFVRLESLFYWCTVLLAGWHGLMYVGDVLFPGFYASYYDFIDLISFGTAVRSEVVFGYGIVRIIQVTSLFLLPGVFLALRRIVRGKYLHFFSLALFLFALCVTYTKSIWFGFVAGFLLCLIPTALLTKEKVLRLRCLAVLLFAVLFVALLNFTVFGGTVFSRAFNTVRPDTSIADLREELENLSTDDERYEELYNQLLDAQGTALSNDIRAQQNRYLLAEWKTSPLWGRGYGAYAEEYVRNEAFPFMYESTVPALMMKLGVLGLGFWGVFIAAVTVIACRFFWKRDRFSLFFWLGIAVSFAMAVQTNPFLFTFTGFSVLLYLLISVSEKETVCKR